MYMLSLSKKSEGKISWRSLLDVRITLERNRKGKSWRILPNVPITLEKIERKNLGRILKKKKEWWEGDKTLEALQKTKRQAA